MGGIGVFFGLSDLRYVCKTLQYKSKAKLIL